MTDGRGSRSRVLAAIEAAGGQALLADIAAQTGLHPNTVRGHLEVLQAAGSVQAEVLPSSGRGRPRHIYRLTSAHASLAGLAAALTAELAAIGDPSAAQSAAERWSRLIPPTHPAETVDEAIAGVVESLDRLGFAAELSPVGDAIAVRNCPYRELAGSTPIICDIHAALVAELLKATEQPVDLVSLDVWPSPDICVARLRRADRTPARTITPHDQGHAVPERSAS